MEENEHPINSGYAMALVEAKDFQIGPSRYMLPSNLSEGDIPMNGSDRNSTE